MKNKKISKFQVVTFWMILSLCWNFILHFYASSELRRYERKYEPNKYSSKLNNIQSFRRYSYDEQLDETLKLIGLLTEYGEEYPEIQEKMKELYPELYEDEPTSAAQE